MEPEVNRTTESTDQLASDTSKDVLAEASVNSTVPAAILRKRWTAEAEQQLALAVQEYKEKGETIDWKAIAKKFPGRTATACTVHYYDLFEGDDAILDEFLGKDDMKLELTVGEFEWDTKKNTITLPVSRFRLIAGK